VARTPALATLTLGCLTEAPAPRRGTGFGGTNSQLHCSALGARRWSEHFRRRRHERCLLISREPQYRRGIFDGGEAISPHAKIWIAQAAQFFGSRHGQCDAAKIVYRHRVLYRFGVGAPFNRKSMPPHPTTPYVGAKIARMTRSIFEPDSPASTCSERAPGGTHGSRV
jgi:hypothetical protein